MAIGFFPAFEPRIVVKFDGDGASLFHHAAVLDALAEEHEVPTLSSFADDREAPPDFDGYPEDLAEAIGPWTAWFSPVEGLRCVEGLLGVLEEPAARERVVGGVEMVIGDLEALRGVLVVARERRVRFRLELA